MELLSTLFKADGFLPHGHCYLWTPGLLWLNIVSDIFIALAYLTIPLTLIYLIKKRRDIPFNWMFWCFGVFILACGGTHVMDVLTTWNPMYWLSGSVKAITAVASVATAILLIKLIPVVLAIPSQEQLARVNKELTHANAELQQANRDLQETHEQLLQAEKMAALGGLVAGVAHEINTPVGIVLTSASLLSRDTNRLRTVYKEEGLSEEELEDYLSIAEQSVHLIQTNVARAADLIQSFKQVAVDQTAGDKRPINLRGYINEILVSLTPALKKCAAVAEVYGSDDLVVTTFPGAIAQIVTNLVMNSLTHGFDGGTMRHGRILITVKTNGDEILLSYVDNGKGIPSALHTKVFKPFFTTNRGAGGSGLGLHILYNLVTRTLNGRVRIDDAHGEGVTFIIEFPNHVDDSLAIDSSIIEEEMA